DEVNDPVPVEAWIFPRDHPEKVRLELSVTQFKQLRLLEYIGLAVRVKQRDLKVSVLNRADDVVIQQGDDIDRIADRRTVVMAGELHHVPKNVPLCYRKLHRLRSEQVGDWRFWIDRPIQHRYLPDLRAPVAPRENGI